jgi:hypothetical protein
MKLELNIDFCNEFFNILTEAKSLSSVCRKNGRFSCVRSTRESLRHKAPADFSTASGENPGADGANSKQNQGVSAVPTGAPVSLWRQAHRPMRACHTGAQRGEAGEVTLPQALTDPDAPDSGIRFLRTPGLLHADCRMHDPHPGRRRWHHVVGTTLSAHPSMRRVAVQ